MKCNREEVNFLGRRISRGYLQVSRIPQSPPAAHTKMVKINMDSFSDDEALARKEDSDKELEVKIEGLRDSKEISKCELVEEL